MRYELTKDLECQNALIDSEHKQLLDAVNNLLDACSQGKGRKAVEPTMNFLLNYVDTHFAHEEQLQAQEGYPNLESHKKFHTEYTKKLRAIASAMTASEASLADLGQLNTHIAALVTHIRTEDKRLGAFIGGKNK